MPLESKGKIIKGWPPERCKRQAQMIRRTKPWKKTTGPKTQEGKIRVSCNAVKHGAFARPWLCLRAALRAHRGFLKSIQCMMQQNPKRRRVFSHAPLLDIFLFHPQGGAAIIDQMRVTGVASHSCPEPLQCL